MPTVNNRIVVSVDIEAGLNETFDQVLDFTDTDGNALDISDWEFTMPIKNGNDQMAQLDDTNAFSILYGSRIVFNYLVKFAPCIYSYKLIGHNTADNVTKTFMQGKFIVTE